MADCNIDNATRYLYDKDYFTRTDAVNTRQLDIHIYENCVILPCQFSRWNKFPWYLGGIVESNGEYAQPSGCDIMAGGYEFNTAETRDETVFYIGMLMKQWGHFLLQGLGRLWATIENVAEYQNCKFVYLASEDLSGTYLECLNLLGISTDKLIRISEPTRFTRVICPDDCNASINQGLHIKYKQIIDALVTSASVLMSDMPIHDKVYLSHGGWKTSVIRDIGEYDIEQFFCKNGYHAISPENLSLKEQIYIINNAKEIATVLCSLSHNYVFANSTARLICLRHSSVFDMSDNYQRKIETLFGNQATYIDAHNSFLPAHGARGPFLYSINENIKLFAQDNNYILPETDNELENLKKYLHVWRVRYHEGQYTQAGLEHAFLQEINRQNFAKYGKYLIDIMDWLSDSQQQQ